MKYYIQFNEKAKYGYEIVTINENGETESIRELTRKTTDGYLYLPEDVVNALNRKLICIKKLSETGTPFELTISDRTHPSGKKAMKLEDIQRYLTEEEYDTYLALVAKAQEAFDAEYNKPLTEKEKLQAKIEKLMKQLNNLGE